METVDFIVSLWPIAAGVFILILTIGKILNRLDVLESKMIRRGKPSMSYSENDRTTHCAGDWSTRQIH